MTKHEFFRTMYKNIARPIMFSMDPEKVHNRITSHGEFLGSYALTRNLLATLFSYQSPALTQKVTGLEFINPIGLSAGFDYDGHLAGVLSSVGFGFNTVGTVTNLPYGGNKKPRLGRLVKSGSLLVNKGFKSDGAKKVSKRLDAKELQDITLGVSIGSSNLPQVNTIKKAVGDYIKGFEVFKDKTYVSYLELNISCPNTSMSESFTSESNLKVLLKEVGRLNIKKPIYIKMPNEISFEDVSKLVRVSIDRNFPNFIFSNLVKDRTNKYFDQSEISAFADRVGNFSGKPTEEGANKLIAFVRKEYGKDVVIIGCGGIFDAAGAYKKIKLGANLVQLITGVVFEGPQLAGEINRGLITRLNRDGFSNISEAVGVDI